jgi:hypothetical protein
VAEHPCGIVRFAAFRSLTDVLSTVEALQEWQKRVKLCSARLLRKIRVSIA